MIKIARMVAKAIKFSFILFHQRHYIHHYHPDNKGQPADTDDGDYSDDSFIKWVNTSVCFNTFD